jgi:hypothetical protein
MTDQTPVRCDSRLTLNTKGRSSDGRLYSNQIAHCTFTDQSYNDEMNNQQKKINIILVVAISVLAVYSILATYLAVSYANSNNNSHWLLLQRMNGVEAELFSQE